MRRHESNFAYFQQERPLHGAESRIEVCQRGWRRVHGNGEEVPRSCFINLPRLHRENVALRPHQAAQ